MTHIAVQSENVIRNLEIDGRKKVSDPFSPPPLSCLDLMSTQKGIQDSGDWDGAGDRYVLSLPANQSHEERIAAAWGVSHLVTLCSAGLYYSWYFATSLNKLQKYISGG